MTTHLLALTALRRMRPLELFLIALLFTGIMFLSAVPAFAQKVQSVKLSGLVVDENSSPIYGATVVVNGTTNGTSTKSDGTFTLSVEPDDKLTVTVSFIGMKAKEVFVGKNTYIDVQLESEAIGLDEIVVTGYGNVAKESYTGSATVISSEKIEDRPAATFEDILRGHSPGTMVTGVGQPGEANTVRMRGTGSMAATNQPLYVVDGVVWEQDNMSGSSNISSNPTATLNPSDIASVVMLKDAASASLYGSRGANGVIVITTKQGIVSDKPRYSFSAQAGVAEIFSKPKLINGREYADLWVHGEMNALIYSSLAVPSTNNLVKELKALYADKTGYTSSGRNYYEWQKQARSNFNEFYAIPKSDGGHYDYDYFGADADKLPNTDWWDEVTRLAPFHKYNMSVQGGNPNIKYYSSLEYFMQDGIIINSRLSRIAGRMNIRFDNPKRLVNWGLNAYVAQTEQTGPLNSGEAYNMPQFAAVMLPPVIPAYLDDGSYNFNFPNNLLNTHHNPVASARENISSRPMLNINAVGFVQLNIANGIKLKSTVSEYYLYARRRTYYSKYFGSGYSSNGSLTERNTNRLKLLNSNMLFVDKEFGLHSISFTAGSEYESVRSKWTQISAKGFTSDDYPYLSMANEVTGWVGDGQDVSMFSIVSKADYNYNRKYLFSGSFRQDRSSRFAPKHRTGNFWSVSGAWRISNEPFMRSVRFINDLKLKASYGINGTLPSGFYRWRDIYSASGAYMNQMALYSSFIATENLTWEKNKVLNVGFDTQLFRNKVRFTAEYFIRKSSDLLQYYPVSYTSGYANILMNTTAGIINKGVELDLQAQLIRKRGWEWNLNMNAATMSSKHYGLDSDKIGTQIMSNGHSVGAWYMLDWQGIDPETGQNLYKRIDEDGNEYIGTGVNVNKDRRVVGKAVPGVSGGVTTDVSFKNWSATALFTYALDYQIYDLMGSACISNNGYAYYSAADDQLDHWTPEHTETINPLRINSRTTGGGTTRYLVNGNYLKLKNLKLAYAFPTKGLQKLGIRGLSLFAQGENIWVLSYFDDYDPEMATNGYRYTDRYPTARTWTLGVQVRF